MSFDGRAVNSSGWFIRPRGRETGSTGCAERHRHSLPTGYYVMAMAEHREPCESRGSSTVLGAPEGESPSGDSTKCEMLSVSKSSPHFIRKLKSPHGAAASAAGQQPTFDVLTTTPEKPPVFVRSAKASRWQSSRCDSSSRTFPNSSQSKAWYGNSTLSSRRPRLDKGDP